MLGNQLDGGLIFSLMPQSSVGLFPGNRQIACLPGHTSNGTQIEGAPFSPPWGCKTLASYSTTSESILQHEPLRMAFQGPAFAVDPVSAIETGLAPTPGRASAAKVEHEIATPRTCRPRSQNRFSRNCREGRWKRALSRPELPGWWFQATTKIIAPAHLDL